MLIGVVKEIKNNENRVGLTPANVKEYIKHGHQVIIETHAGIGVNFTDEDYVNAGATIINSAKRGLCKS